VRTSHFNWVTSSLNYCMSGLN